ncbi:hypothetical protein MJO28_002151 [Puccinia striiformis f. sp. tritici]|nr:hypothetical protein Pst134EA_002619 [Puccinia striiformis f. sp. tritici]KNF05964.1 hypothetical protein PSTG_00957 [Puccinia striiformis f. sp. tritici PST-78]KAH9464207.1 hypothetical protein Pst134EB_003740 [Puccinia striiformis f. sp. tritici]KAH9471990.1 hypothetical protein Pst134EA_002619 [Puccinia striiformis f. sp. tritici]KAI7961662.1 hypothetical protein MJO28_002151 [Puccinia striiformis f. sp. tritici]KAI7966479.1 hypothetical protein MJO29_002227 [Puccinia striiformis f. sp. 
MFFQSNLTIAFAFLELLNSPLVVAAPRSAKTSGRRVASPQVATTCGAYQIVGARGTEESQSGSIAYANLIKVVEATIPRGSNVEIQYISDLEYVQSVDEGIKSGAAHLSSQTVKCPNQKYVFVGYSKGAMVIQKLMSQLPIAADKVVAAVMFGNPFHTPGAPQNRCSGIGGAGIASPFTTPIPPQYVSLTYDCCKQWDAVCQTFGLPTVHLSYGGSQDETDAAAFVVSQLRTKLGRSK